MLDLPGFWSEDVSIGQNAIYIIDAECFFELEVIVKCVKTCVEQIPLARQEWVVWQQRLLAGENFRIKNQCPFGVLKGKWLT